MDPDDDTDEWTDEDERAYRELEYERRDLDADFQWRQENT